MLDKTAPSPSSAGPPSVQNARKLRDSCTECASSKVKCGKEKPTCSRCVRRGVKCTYMASRRTGRTSSNASKSAMENNQNGATINVNSGTGSARNEATETSRPTLRVGTPFNPQSMTTTTTSTTATNTSAAGDQQSRQSTPGPGPESDAIDPELWSSIMSPSALITCDPASLSPPLTSIGTDVGSLFDLDFHSPMVIDYPAAEQAGDSGGQPISDLVSRINGSVTDRDAFASHHLTSEFDWSVVKKPQCCFSIAIDILSRLFPPAPAGCKHPPANQIDTPKARTIESVISENKQTIESLTRLLDCECSRDQYLISLMTLIALKVMGWYAAAADDAVSAQPAAFEWPGSESPSRSRSSVSSGSVASGSLGEQVLRLPTIVGNYCVAGQHQGRMAAQLVLSELHRVQKIVNGLSARLESIRLRAARDGGSGASSGSSSVGDVGEQPLGGARAGPFSVPTFTQLEEDLRRRFRMLSSETINVLRRA
ncbi:aflatoxin regulatory protein-domain-containing protein [Triangularia setosa]|uniref:Aflatoxin regulatory protein-domain-containing protein n=1 Tax=Triangularia setosa TaxID=2587417 RepID=A0AAN7A6S2_9PEZI|nr:aflatoxin regulatory protein-domain-containing protein [Podospora setosa]